VAFGDVVRRTLRGDFAPRPPDAPADLVAPAMGLLRTERDCCSERCSGFWRDLRLLAPAEAAARWLSADEIEAWEERAATMQEAAGLGREMADRRALGLVWRASRNVEPPKPTSPLSAAPTDKDVEKAASKAMAMRKPSLIHARICLRRRPCHSALNRYHPLDCGPRRAFLNW
jgi:hypothetical protein